MRRAAVVWVASLLATCGLLALPLVAFAATSAVTIQGSAFNPPTTTVHVGDAVTWTNRDGFSHTATSDTAVWDTGIINTGASKTVTFATAGTFAYHCSIHTFMKGTIVVQAATTPAPTQPPTPVPTAPPTPVRTATPTVAPTEAPTPASTTAAPTVTASPTIAAAETPNASPSASAVAGQVTPAPTAGAGQGPLLVGAAALAIVGLGAIAFVLARRR